MGRDVNIDFLRGAFILMIALDHLGWMVKRAMAPTPAHFPFVTWTHLGWSSAAEFFVFFSGYVIGLVYIRTLNQKGLLLLGARAFHRAWQLYCFNIITWVISALAVGVLFDADLQILSATQFDRAQQTNGFDALANFALLQDGPAFFDILQLYMVLLLATPLLLYICRWNVVALLGVSLALWGLSQIKPDWTIYRSGNYWGFNPLSWQLIFCFGLVAARIKLFDWLKSKAKWALIIGTGIPLGIIFVLKALAILGWSGFHEEAFFGILGKQHLGILRIVHFLLSLVFLFSILPRDGAIESWWLGRETARVGRFSLETFCFSTVICYITAATVLTKLGIHVAVLAFTGVFVVASIYCFARFMEFIRSEPWR
ncbi:hypothetical protein ASF43_08640 [Pseudorhodoferax sp. Leaf267]|nr:hypothetical protein ASF43_08640 [Pseudorhodoferax sp. Leaf267]